MEENLISFKELYSCYLKATYSIEMNGRIIEPGETIAKFDNIQIADFKAYSDMVSANGGYGNKAWVFWETPRDLVLNFSQGVFSKEHFALFNNSKMYEISQPEILISNTEELESDEEGKFEIKQDPVDIFVYRKDTGEKIEFTIYGKVITISQPFVECIIDYTYYYNNTAQVVEIGNKLIEGFLSFEGRTRVKDDTTGLTTTGIIKIPKLKLMSDLSMRLGKQATPIVASFSATAVPIGVKGKNHTMEFMFLNNDIDSDF